MSAIPGRPSTLHYDCSRGVSDYAEPLCQTIGGGVLDEFVAGQLLAAVEPAAVEASLAAIEDVERERQRLDGLWRQRLERARYEEDRAARQYHAVEPENRLVARELERRWEQALKDHQQLEREYEAFLSGQPGHLSPEEREELLALSHDLPAVWRAPTTTPADRQRIARLLLDRVVVTVVGTSEQVAVRLEWAGGHTGDHVIIRPVARYDQRSDYPKLVARLRELHGQRLSSAAIAEHLNREGFRPPKRTTRFQRGMVHRLVTKLGLGRPRVPPDDERALLGPHEWWLSELSERLGIPRDTLHRWRRVGWVHGAQARRTARPLGALGRRGRVGAAQPLEELPQDLGQSAAAEGADDPQGAGPMRRPKRFFRGSGRRGGAAAGSPIQVAPSEALWVALGTYVQALEVAQRAGRAHRPEASSQEQLAMVYAKLIGVFVQHWVLLTATWTQNDRSLMKAAATLREWINNLAEALDDLKKLADLLERLREILRGDRVERRHRKPSHFQLLENPELLEWQI